MTAFDLLLRGGLVVDGTGAPGRPGDVGVLGDRILAVGDLSAVDSGEVATTIDCAGLVVTPGFIDPHGHSDGSLFLDGGLASHLRQGFTTQLSGNVAADPGWEGIVISYAASHPDWSGRSLAELGEALDRDPADIAFDALIDDRLDVSIVIHCMAEADVETIMAVPWIAVCTDAEGRRPGHPILDAGRPHPRTYGSTARVLGPYVRERGGLALETAVAKLTSVPAARLGLRDRGVLREGAMADLVAFDPGTAADVATYAEPARHPIGVDHVVVNGCLAVRDGAETGERAGRLLRHAG